MYLNDKFGVPARLPRNFQMWSAFNYCKREALSISEIMPLPVQWDNAGGLRRAEAPDWGLRTGDGGRTKKQGVATTDRKRRPEAAAL